MKKLIEQHSDLIDRLRGQLALQKKKAIVAGCLIMVMLLMWVRLLLKQGPRHASAAPAAVQSEQIDTQGETAVQFLDLPTVPGRNDRLTRDFFVVQDWREFVRTGEVETERNILGEDVDGIAKKIANKLKLEIIELGDRPQAFINGKLLSVGDRLLVRDGLDRYECEVLSINDNAVQVKCGEVEIELKLKQVIDYENEY